MKATGIVRRIDDLGRVVIPKEIRRTARIREGDPMEIYVGQGDEIVLRKYSTMASLGQYAKDYAAALAKVSGFGVLICDRHKVIDAAGTPKQALLGQPLTKAVIDGEGYADNEFAAKDIKQFNPVDGLKIRAFLNVPIIVSGETDGYVLLLAKDETTVAGEAEIKLLLTAATYISLLLSEF